jgi:hypothetical protein
MYVSRTERLRMSLSLNSLRGRIIIKRTGAKRGHSVCCRSTQRIRLIGQGNALLTQCVLLPRNAQNALLSFFCRSKGNSLQLALLSLILSLILCLLEALP